MRCRLLLIATSLLGACRTAPLDMPIAVVSMPGQDFASSPQDVGAVITDLARRPVDLAQPADAQSCAALVKCLAACVDQVCSNDCFANAGPKAQALVQQIGQCTFDFCATQQGSRPPRCDQNGNDPLNGPSGACNTCQTNAVAALFGVPCQPANDPDCNPAACIGDEKTCLSQ